MSLCLPSGLFPSSFPTKTMYSLSSDVCYQRITPKSEAVCIILKHNFLWWGVANPTSKPQGCGPPIFDSLQLLSSILSATIAI
jgi:hypothetical protein